MVVQACAHRANPAAAFRLVNRVGEADVGGIMGSSPGLFHLEVDEHGAG
jgi:hypothetical protein